MIFDKEYDRALWLMLKADKKNRRVIAGFVKSIPGRMLQEIQEKLLILSEYEKNKVRFCDREEKHLKGEYETSDRILYWFSIDAGTMALNLGYQVFDGVRYEDVFNISLMPITNRDGLQKLDEVNIGSIGYDITEVIHNEDSVLVNSHENEYNLMKTSLGHMVFYFKDNAVIKKYGVKRVNLNRIPKELEVTDLGRSKVRRKKPL